MKLQFKLLLVVIIYTLTIHVACLASTPEILQARSNYIKIWHDKVGTPHVVASTTYGAFYGYGYSVAKDRMFQIELLRRSTEGTLSEIFGKDFIEADYMARRDRVSFSDMQKGLDRSSDNFKNALKAFTNGLNRAIKDGRAGKFLIDPAFKKVGIKPSPFTELQVLNIFAGTMAARYNDFTQELDNMHLLSSLVKKYGARSASEIFEDVVFYYDPKVYTTLGKSKNYTPIMRHISRFSVPGGSSEPTHSPTIKTIKRNETLKKIGIPDKSGSYGIVMSNKYKGESKAWLLGGPQMGYFKPSGVYSIGLHTPEFDIVGTTPVGYIFIMFAANRNMAFTATAGVGNLVDLIAVKQDPKRPDAFIGDGFEIEKKSRIEQIYVKDLKKPVSRTITYTNLGPVIASEDGIYYIKNRGWKGKVVDSYAGWFDSTFSTNISEWLDASDRNALSINWLAADKMGNIAYVHCGVDKTRKTFGDDRLPVMTPTDFQYPDQRLAGVNPESGYYVNWNAPPVFGFRDGDLQSGWAADQRTKYISDHVKLNKSLWSIDYLKRLDHDIAFTDQRAYFFKDILLTFIDPQMFSPLAKKALKLLKTWDNTRTDNNGDGMLDNNAAGLFDAFWNNLYGKVMGYILGKFAWISGSDSTWTQSAPMIRALLKQTRYNFLGNKSAKNIITKIFLKTVNDYSKDGINIPASKCPPMVFSGVNHVGAPTMTKAASFVPFMNRGSDVQLVELSPDGISVFGCMPPGNKSFGNNEVDQMNDFKNFVFHKRALTMSEVRNLNGKFEVLKP